MLSVKKYVAFDRVLLFRDSRKPHLVSFRELTYMSIADEILDRVGRNMLFPLKPRAPGATIRRAFFVAEELWNDLNSPDGDEEWEDRIGRLRADLEVFVTEETITPKYLFLLYPSDEAVWEIRSVRDKPSVRVFSLFADKDVLVSTDYAKREDLGGWEDRGWKAMKRRAKTYWRNLFMTYNPVVTVDVSEVCSGASNGIFYKDRGEKA